MWKAIKYYRQRRARGDKVKPIWQLVILVPIAAINLGTEKLLEYLDDKFNPVDPNFWSDDDAR